MTLGALTTVPSLLPNKQWIFWFSYLPLAGLVLLCWEVFFFHHTWTSSSSSFHTWLRHLKHKNYSIRTLLRGTEPWWDTSPIAHLDWSIRPKCFSHSPSYSSYRVSLLPSLFMVSSSIISLQSTSKVLGTPSSERKNALRYFGDNTEWHH